jgi:hypothetical protein
VVSLVNRLNGAPVYDLVGLLTAMRADWQGHAWVIGMVFSTLVPTAVHLVIALLATITLPTDGMRGWMAARIAARADSGAGFTAAGLVLSLMFTAYALVLSIGLVWLAGWGWDGIGWLAARILDWMSALAQALA